MADQENQAEPEAERASWTIKSVPVETRKLAIACASRQGQTMAEWLTRAVRNQAHLEAGERVLPPAPRPAGALTVPGAPWAPVAVPELGALADLMQAARAIAEAAGVPIPKATARHALALTTAQLRAARGLPPKTPRQTKHENGQTIEDEGEFAPRQTGP
jgi:hypothetical protein